MLGISNDYIVIAGKSTVSCRPLKLDNDGDQVNNGNTSAVAVATTPPPDVAFPQEWKAKKCHIECISVSGDGRLLAVADSLHGLTIFERKGANPPGEWALLFSAVAEKRIIKLQFTNGDNQYLTFLDKQGDIFAVLISADHQQVSKMKKIMGHTSFISDYLTRVQHQQIISCDRDEKIRISNFPDAFTIQGFKLGHTESVISMALLEEQGYLLSVSIGTLILWHIKKPITGTSTEFVQKWSVKNILPDMANEEVTSMKACCNGDSILVSVTFAGPSIVILRIQLSSMMKVEVLRVLDTGSELIFMEWAAVNGQSSLLVYTPLETSVLTCWTFSRNGEMTPNKLSHTFSEEIMADVKALGETHKPSLVPMKKRQTAFEDSVAKHPHYEHKV